MKKILFTLLFLLLPIAGFSQGLGIANALTNLDQDYAYGTNIALYGSFDVGSSSYSGSAWEALNHRVITDFSGNDTTNHNKILFINNSQINIVLYSTDNINTGFANPNAFSTGGGGTSPVSITIKVQKLVSGTWTTYKSVTRNASLIIPVPKVNPNNGVIMGLLYDKFGNYIKFHDGTSSSPISTDDGVSFNDDRNYFVPYVTGALAAVDYFVCNPPPSVFKYLPPYSSGTGIAGGDIYGSQYFNSGYEGIQQINFRVPSDAGTDDMKLVFSLANGSCGAPYSFSAGSSKLSMGSWH
jgi:hypothetical protein